MKKVFAILAATVLFAGIASAQLGINVGYAPQTYSGSMNPSSMHGFFAGVNYNINLTGDLGVSVGADFRFNTGKDETSYSIPLVGTVTYENNHTQTLIDVPVLFNYGLHITDDFKISIFAGPTFTYALSGNTHSKLTANVVGYTGDTEGDDDWYDDNRTRFDIAGTAGVSLQYKAFRLLGGYNYGLLDLDKRDDYKLKASNWFVGLGFSL